MAAVPCLTRFLAWAHVVVAHAMAFEVHATASEERVYRLLVRDDTGGVGLERGDHEVVHEPDLLLTGESPFRFCHRRLRLRFGYGEPFGILGEAHLNLADGVEVFGELIGIFLSQTACSVARFFHDGIEHAFLTSDVCLSLRQRGFLVGEQFVKNGDGVLNFGDWFPLSVP